MTKSEMFDWMLENRISIQYCVATKWTREDNSYFYCDFIISSPTTQFSGYPTVTEAILEISSWYKWDKK